MQQLETTLERGEQVRRVVRSPLEGGAAFLSPEAQVQRMAELLGDGAITVDAGPPPASMRGRLAEHLEELVERALGVCGAPSPYIAAWSAMPDDREERVADQLFRARSVGATGIAIAVGSLSKIAAPALTPEDSATLRALVKATADAPLVVLIDDGDAWVGGYEEPVALSVMLARAAITAHDGRALDATLDLTATEANAGVATLEPNTRDARVETPNANANASANANANANANSEKSASDASLLDQTHDTSAEPREANARDEGRLDTSEIDAGLLDTRPDAHVEAHDATALNASAEALVASMLDANESHASVLDANESESALDANESESDAGLDDVMANEDVCVEHGDGAVSTLDVDVDVDREDRGVLRADQVGARDMSAGEQVAAHGETTDLTETHVDAEVAEAVHETKRSERERARRRQTAGVPARGAGDAWRSWAIALGAARGPQPLAAFEKLFVDCYVPLANAIAAGLEEPRAIRAHEEFRDGFERSYADAFATFGATGRRPRLVMDAYDVAVRQARLHNARTTQVFLVDSMRYDLGALVRDEIATRAAGTASLTSESLLWSALPTTTHRQLETLARGMDALRAPGAEESSDSLRGRSAETVRRVRVGSRELYKLDVVPSLLGALPEAGAGHGAARVVGALADIAERIADGVLHHIASLAPRTQLVVLGDHGFTVDRRGGISHGGATPEEVLVPCLCYLVADLH